MKAIHILPPAQYREDAELVAAALRVAGYQCDAGLAYLLWSWVSHDVAASWLCLESNDNILDRVLPFIEPGAGT